MNNSRIRLKFKISCLKQEDKTSFTPNNVVILLTVYELDTCSRELNTGFTLKDCLFGVSKITENADPDKYVYTGCGVAFDLCLIFSLPDGSMSKNVIIFGAGMISSLRIDNKKWYFNC